MTNKNKKNFFKSFLATTSAFAVITGASNSAMGAAAQYTTNDGGPSRIADGLSTTNANDLITPWAADDSFFWSHVQNLRLGTGANIATVATLDLNSQVGINIEVRNDSSIASLVDSTAVLHLKQTANLVINDNFTLTLGGNAGLLADGVTAQAAGDFSGLGDVTLGSGGGGSVLTINSNATFGGTIDSDANDDGVININAGKTVTFNSIVGGGQEIAEINLVGANSVVVFNKDVKALTILTKDAAAEIRVANKTITGNVDSDGNGGILQFTVGAGGVTGTIGAANALTEVEFNAGGNAIALGGNAKATDFTFGADGDTVTAGGTITGNVDFAQKASTLIANGGLITGDVDNTGGNAVRGTLRFTAAGGVTGTIGATNPLTLVEASGNGVVALHSGESKATTFKTSNAGAVIEVAAGGVGTLTGNIDATAAGGTLRFLGAGQVTGTIGANNALTLVEARGNGAVVQLDDTIDTATLNIKNGATVQAADNSAAAIAAINIGEVGGAGTLVIDAGGGDYDLLNGTAITFAHADSKLKLTNTTNAGNRIVTLHNDLAPGGGNDLVGSLEINSAGTKTLTVTENAAETIGDDNTHRLNKLVVSGDQNAIINPDIFAKTITVSSTANVTFGGAIDGDANANSAINFTAAGNTAFDNDVTATTLAFADNARIVTVADGKVLTVNTITSGAGNGSQLTLAGDTNIALGGAQTVAVDLITAAANGNTVNLGAGAYTVPDIQLIHAGGTLKLANGFELTGGMNVAAGNAATVTFLGNGKVTGALGGAGNPVGAVTVAGNSTLQLGGNVNATSLDGNVANAQNVKFINAGNITVAGPVGNIQAFDQIEFNGGGRVTFGANDLTAGQKLHFTADTEVVTNGYDLAATDITNANGVNGSKLTVNVDQAITGDIGTSAVQPFGTLHVVGNKTVTLNTANFFAGVTGANADVIFNNGAGSSVSFLGGVANINNANFVQDGTVLGEVHTGTIDVQAGRTATFEGTVFEGGVNGMKMHANNAQADFTARVVLNMPILANVAGNGIINFNGGVDLQSKIGTGLLKVASVTIGGDSTINANIHSGAINVGNHEVTLVNDKTFDGTTTFNGTTITLGGNDLTMTGGNVTFTGESTIKTTVNGKNLGNLVASGAGSNILLAAGAANKIKVEVTEGALAPDGTTIVLIRKDAGGTLNLDINRITVTKAGIFSSWEDTVTDEGLILTQNLQVEKETNRIAQEQGTSDVVTTAFASAFEKAEPGTQGFDVLSQVSLITEEEKLNDAQARIANTTANEVSAVNLNTINVVTDTISARIADVTSFVSPIVSTPVISSPVSTSPATAPTTGRGTSPVKTGVGKNIKVSSENNYISGIASGDDHTRFGAWATPFYSKSTQKKRSGTSGFKADSYGGTFGVDTKANDNMVIGLAFSAMNTDIKHKDFKSGDKTKVTSFLVSAYATHQFTNNWFGQSVFSMGSSSVNNKENRRISNTQLAIAEGKYNSMMFAAEVLGGYNHVVNSKFVVTPMFGLNYNRINDGGYTESGSNAGPQLMEVTKRASQKLDVVGGIRLTAMPFMTNGVEITPEAHAFVRHDVIGKGAKVNAKIPGLNLPSEKAKLQKTFYNVGASLNAAYGAMDYGVSADANFANKYVGVQGSVKVRVNF